MEKIKASKFEILLDNFINRYYVSGSFSKNDFEELLSRAILSEDRELRRVACKIIRRLKLKNLLDYVRVLLNDEDSIIKSLALLAIAQFKDDQSFNKVVELFNSDTKIVKSSSLLALGSIDKPEGYKLIFEALEDEYEEVRENAIIASSWINSPKTIPLLIDAYSKEKNKNLKIRIIKSFALLNSEIINKKLEEIVLTESDDIIVINAINSLLKKGISKYSLLANTILFKAINDNYKITKLVEYSRKNLYNIVSQPIWETKQIKEEDQRLIFRFIEEDLTHKYHIRSEELKKLAINCLKNLNKQYHQIVVKLFENDLSNSLKIEIINFLSNPKVDRNFKILLLEFISDEDRLIREQSLFAIMDNQPLNALTSHINEKIFSMEYSYLKLVALGIIYSNMVGI